MTRLFWADTLALVSFFTAAGVLNERLVAGMAWGEVAAARAWGVPLMLLTARPYGAWRDWAMRAGGAPRRGAVGRLVLDTGALLSFQVPLYALVLLLGGASGPEVARGCAGAAVLMLATGRLYGLWLEAVRQWMRAEPSP